MPYKDPEKRRAVKRRWKENHLEEYRTQQREARRLRRVQDREAHYRHRAKRRREAFEAAGGRCWYCGRPIFLESFELDHATPWAAGGRDVPENFRAACRQCNREKLDATEAEVAPAGQLRLPVALGIPAPRAAGCYDGTPF